jgi:hypothetical protein
MFVRVLNRPAVAQRAAPAEWCFVIGRRVGRKVHVQDAYRISQATLAAVGASPLDLFRAFCGAFGCELMLGSKKMGKFLLEPQEPASIRYRTNDSSYESLGELLISNPMGILVERDELVSLLKHLDREEQAVARGFYLSGWSGTQPYTFDRIGRGHRHVEAVCISILGNTQPARMAEYVRRANADGAGGDGLIRCR